MARKTRSSAKGQRSFGIEDAEKIVQQGVSAGTRIHITIPQEFLKPGESRHMTVTGYGIQELTNEILTKFGGRVAQEEQAVA
jgi:hypothetical protein